VFVSDSLVISKLPTLDLMMLWVKGVQEKYAEEAVLDLLVIDAVGQGLEVDR
jgi:hypothetical protein